MDHINNPTTEDLNKLEKFKRAYYMLYNKELQQEDLEKTDKLKKLILHLFNRAYYILYGKELQQEDLKKTDELNKLVQNSEQQIAENNEELYENNVKYNYYTNTLELINNSNSSLDLDYINYKLEQFNTHFIESRHYIGMYVPQNNQSNTLQNSATPYIPQPKPSKSNSSSEAMREFSIKNKNSTSTSSYDDESTLCYNIETGEFSIKTYKEIKQNNSLKKVMFPNREKTSNKTTFKPKIINTFREARCEFSQANTIYINDLGSCTCKYGGLINDVSNYTITINDGYKLLGVDIKLSNDNIECTKKTYCYYLGDDNRLYYGALSDEEMKEKYVLNIKINKMSVPLNIKSSIQKKLLPRLKDNKKLYFSKPGAERKECTVRFDDEIQKLIFNIDGTDYYFTNDDYVGVAMKFISSIETEPKPQPLAIKPKPSESLESKLRTRKILTSIELTHPSIETAKEIFLTNYYLEQFNTIKNRIKSNCIITNEMLEMYCEVAEYLKLSPCATIQDLKRIAFNINYQEIYTEKTEKYSNYSVYFKNYQLLSKKDGMPYEKTEELISEWYQGVRNRYSYEDIIKTEEQYKKLFICLCLLKYCNDKSQQDCFQYYSQLKAQDRRLYEFVSSYSNSTNLTADHIKYTLQMGVSSIVHQLNTNNKGKNKLNIKLSQDSDDTEKFIKFIYEQIKENKEYQTLYNMYTKIYENKTEQSLTIPQPQPQLESPSLSETSITPASPPSEEPSKPLTSPSESEEESASESEEDLESESQPQPQPELKPKPEPEPETKPSNPESTLGYIEDKERLPEYVLCYNLKAKKFNICSKESINKNKDNYLICYKNNDKNEVCGADSKKEVYNSVINTRIKLKDNSERFIEYDCQELEGYIDTRNMVIRHMYNQKSEYNETLMTLDDEEVNTSKHICYFLSKGKEITKHYQPTLEGTLGYQNTNSNDNYIWMFYKEDETNHIELFDFDQYDQKQKHNPKIFSISTDAEGRKTINFFKCEDGKLEKEKEEQLKEYPTLENPGILEQEQPATADYIEKPEPELKPDSSSLSNADTTSTSSPSKEPSTPSAESEEDLDSESEPLTAEPKPQPEPVSESSKPKPELKPSKPESESTLLPMATSMAGSLSNPDEPMSVFPVSIETPSSSGTSDLFPALSKPIIERAVSKLDEDPKKPLSALSEDSDMYSYDSSTTTQTMLDLSPDMVKILALYNYKKSLNNKLKILMITRGIFGLDEGSQEEDQIIFNYYTKVCEKADELLNKQLEEKSINLEYSLEEMDKQVSSNQKLRQQVAQTSKELGYTQALLKFDEQAQKYIQPILDYVILDMMKQDIEEKKVVKEEWPILPGCLDDVINFSDLDAKKQQEAIVAKQEELKKRIKIDIISEGMKIFAKQYFFGANGVEKSDEDLKQRYLAQDFYRHLDDFYYHTQEIQYPNDYIAQLFTERTDKRRYPEVNYNIILQALLAFIQGRLCGRYTKQQLLKITKYSKFDIVKRDLFANMFITTDDKYKDNATDEDTSADHLLRRYVLSNSGGSNSISSLLLLSSTHQVLCLQSKDFESMYAQIDEKEEEKKELEKKEKYLKGIEEKIKSNKDELKKIQNKLNSKTALTAKEKEDKVKLETGINNLEETLESETKLLQTKKEKLKKEEEKSKQEKAKLKEEYEQYYLKVQKELLLQYREDMKFSEELQGLETADEIRKCLQSKYVELEKEQSKFANTLREYLLNDPVAKAGWLKTYSQRSFGFEVKKCYGEIKIVEGVNVEDCRNLIEQWNTAINNMESEKNTKQTIETTLSESYALYRHIVNGDLYFPKEIEYKNFLEDRKEDSLLLYNLGTEEIVMNYINLVNSQDKEEQTVNFSSCIPSDFATKQAFTVTDHDITTVVWRSVVGSKQKESCYQTYLSMYIQYLQDNGLSLLDINLASLTDAVRFAVTNSFVKSQIIKNREELEKSHDKPKEGMVKTEENKDEPKKEDDKEKDSIDLFGNFMKNFKESLGIKAALYRNIFTVDELIEIYKPNAGDDSKELRQQIQLLGEQEYDKFDDINKSRLLSLYYYILQYAPESKPLMNALKADHPILYLSLPLGCEFRSTNDAGNKAAAFIRGMSRKEPDELAYSLLQRSKQILSNYWNETASGGMDIITDENNVGIIATKLIENYHLPKSFLINPYVSSTLLKAEDEFYEEKEMTNTEQIDKNSKMIDRVLDKICCNFKNQSNYYYDIFCWSVYMLTDNLEETQKQQILIHFLYTLELFFLLFRFCNSKLIKLALIK